MIYLHPMRPQGKLQWHKVEFDIGTTGIIEPREVNKAILNGLTELKTDIYVDAMSIASDREIKHI